MNEISTICDLPSISEEFSSEVSVLHNSGNSQLKFSYYDENGLEKEFTIEIAGVYKFIFTSDSCCDPFQIENSFERIISLGNSKLLGEVKRNANMSGISVSNESKHFMMYISDYGCYEYVAEKMSFRISDKIK